MSVGVAGHRYDSITFCHLKRLDQTCPTEPFSIYRHGRLDSCYVGAQRICPTGIGVELFEPRQYYRSRARPAAQKSHFLCPTSLQHSWMCYKNNMRAPSQILHAVSLVPSGRFLVSDKCIQPKMTPADPLTIRRKGYRFSCIWKDYMKSDRIRVNLLSFI
jgi:hypothetical protein